MQIDQLLGTWRTTKIRWHEGAENIYSETDNWRQYEFKPGGKLTESANDRGKLQNFDNIANWRIEKDQIVISEYHTRESRVLELTEATLVVQKAATGVTYFMVRV